MIFVRFGLCLCLRVTVPIAETYHVTKKLIELLYLREINVLEDEKQPILNALTLLKISGVNENFQVQQSKFAFKALSLYVKFHFHPKFVRNLVPPPRAPGPQGPQMPEPAKIQQRRNTVVGVSQAPAKRTAQRAQSV